MKVDTTRIRCARADEANALTELAMRSKASWGYDAAFMNACRRELTLTAEDVASGLTYVLEVDHAIRGFYALSWASHKRMQLDHLFLEPRVLRKGYGTALFTHAAERAREAGALVLEILSDPFAEAFYRSQGALPRGSLPSASIAGRLLPLLELVLGEQ